MISEIFTNFLIRKLHFEYFDENLIKGLGQKIVGKFLTLEIDYQGYFSQTN